MVESPYKGGYIGIMWDPRLKGYSKFKDFVVGIFLSRELFGNLRFSNPEGNWYMLGICFFCAQDF